MNGEAITYILVFMAGMLMGHMRIVVNFLLILDYLLVLQVLNGMFKGSPASLLNIDTARFQAHVKITAGQDKGKEVWLEYEDISKLA